MEVCSGIPKIPGAVAVSELAFECIVRGYTVTKVERGCPMSDRVFQERKCARTCLVLRLLVAPLELLPPAGQVPFGLDGFALIW
jgi:hypothetical protein